MLCTSEHQSARIHLWTDLPPSLQTAHFESSPSLRHVCQRAKQVSQHVNCAYSLIPAPFLLALFSPQLFYNNWRCEETAGRGLPLENFGVKTEEMEQVCVFSFICIFVVPPLQCNFAFPCPSQKRHSPTRPHHSQITTPDSKI